jgi:hypothetical protein
MTREEVIAAIKEAKEELGHVPSLQELRRLGKVSMRAIRRLFCTYTEALRACGYEPHGSGIQVSPRSLFVDWAKVVRRLGRMPSVSEYELHGNYSVRPMLRLFRMWRHVGQGMLEYGRSQAFDGEWNDVLELVADHLTGRAAAKISMPAKDSPKRHTTLTGAPMYGTPMVNAPLMFCPTNEAGVSVLFGAVHRELGFAILQVQNGFPDCEAMQEVEPGRCQRKKIEFEFLSRNFLAHMHPLDGCDLIVCWEDNWPDSPLEVLELKSAVEELIKEARFPMCRGCRGRKG